MALARHIRSLPDLLLEEGILTLEQLQHAKAQAATTNLPLSQVLVQQELVTEQALTALLGEAYGVTTIDLATHLVKPEVVQLVPEPLARKHTLMPVFKIAETLTVAMSDPLNVFAIDELHLKTRCEIKVVLASETAIRRAIDQYYGSSGTIAEVAQAIEAAQLPENEAEAAQEAPIVRLVNLLILQAMKEGASDIHLEPGDGVLRTRFRIDGILREVNGPPKHLQAPVVSRIKILASLDIAEKRKAQDGRFRLTVEQREIDLRVATIPASWGEKVVLRLLDRASVQFGLEQLGFSSAALTCVQQCLQSPYGMFLVTGPTGSGKTTTLYAALSTINSVEKNIVTIEDPIEYELPGINQVQVNLKADVTFASSLRAFLRQDPDVIMVGEIRDRETAEIAIQAALTGHLVFSTLHTNDASGALTRLLDMGVEPFLIASTVIGVVGQRLVRVICPKCRQLLPAPTAVTEPLHLPENTSLYRGAGCPTCKQTGYKGRTVIEEVLLVTDPIRALLQARSPTHLIRQTAHQGGMQTMREDGLQKVARGVTTLEEVLRVTQLEESS